MNHIKEEREGQGGKYSHMNSQSSEVTAKEKKERIHSSDSVRMRGKYSAEPFFNPVTGQYKQMRFTSAG